MRPLLCIVAFGGLWPTGTDEPVVTCKNPACEIILPSGYREILPRKQVMRFTRTSGPETWAKITATVAPAPEALPQRSGVSSDQILPLLGLPADAQETFRTRAWHDLDIGLIEYRAVADDLRVFGISTVLPLANKGLIITVWAPDPLEKEVRDDFSAVLFRIAHFQTNWHTPEELRRMDLLDRIGWGGAGLLAAYPLAWIFLFRGHPMRLHWLRIGWMGLAAVMLFLPITSPGGMGSHGVLFQAILTPVILLSLIARRLKMAIELG